MSRPFGESAGGVPVTGGFAGPGFDGFTGVGFVAAFAGWGQGGDAQFATADPAAAGACCGRAGMEPSSTNTISGKANCMLGSGTPVLTRNPKRDTVRLIFAFTLPTTCSRQVASRTL